MKIRRQRLRVYHDRGIAVAFAEVAQDLVVGAVFFYDVNDVPNLLVKEAHNAHIGTILLCTIVVVLGHLSGQFFQGFSMRHGQRQEPGFRELPNVGI